MRPNLGRISWLLLGFFEFQLMQAGYEDLCDANCNHNTIDDEDGIETNLCLVIHSCKLGQVFV